MPYLYYNMHFIYNNKKNDEIVILQLIFQKVLPEIQELAFRLKSKRNEKQGISPLL